MAKKKRKSGHKPAPPKATRAATEALPKEEAIRETASHLSGYEWGVSIGLGLLILTRPWVDGLTFPISNAFFLWGIALCFALWAACLLTRGVPLHSITPILILVALYAVFLLTWPSSIRAEHTHKSLLLWASYIFVFLLASNGMQSRKAIGVLLTVFVAVGVAQSIYGALQLKYLLPEIRKTLQSNPALMMMNFNETTFTPALRERLTVNRAFGSFLYPNALAAFLILIIPCAIGGVLYSWEKLRADAPQGADSPPQAADTRYRAVAASMGVWLIAILGTFAIYGFAYAFENQDESWREHPVPWVFWVGIVPVLVGIIPFILIQRLGWRRAWLWLGVGGGTFAIGTLLYGLWLSFSRGGALGLFGALVLAVGLFVLQLRLPPRLRKQAAPALAAVLLIALGALALSGAPSGWAQGDAATAEAAPAPDDPLALEGYDPELGHLSRMGTVALRLSYWRVGLRMIQQNFLTGVGLGNFSTAYAQYQYLGAGDVQSTHNDFIQVFTESGVLGFLLFSAFWGYFMFWGGRRILRETDPAARWLLLGMYTGVLALTLHSLVDFNFQNPSLATLQFLITGLFFAYAQGPRREEARSSRVQAMAVPLLIAAALATGGSVRMARAEGVIGKRNQLPTQFNVARFFFEQADPAAFDPQNPPAQSVLALATLIPRRDVVEQFAEFWVQTGPQQTRKLSRNEGIPIEQSFVLVRNPVLAREVVWKHIDARVAELEYGDALYPHDPTISVQLYSWYNYLSDHARSVDDRKDYIIRALEWAKACVDRSPQQSHCREYYGNALWKRASIESDDNKRRDYYETGLQEFKKATEYYPISEHMWDIYAEALEKYGEALSGAGATEAGTRYLQQGLTARQRAADLRAQKAAL